MTVRRPVITAVLTVLLAFTATAGALLLGGGDGGRPVAAADAQAERAAALTERGIAKMKRHDFSGALVDARAARAAAPDAVRPFGVLVDALVELGRYDEAAVALQEMVDRKPGLDSYARVSYVRELHGDLAGAAAAMRRAVSAGGDVPESTAAVRALLGDVELLRGRTRAARREYRAALRLVPGHPASVYGLARADVASGRLDRAARRLRPLAAEQAEPGYALALAEVELARGDRAAGRRALDRNRELERTERAAGTRTAVERAIVEADHGSPQLAVDVARQGWAESPSVRAADALGWALVRAGRPGAGLAWAQRALKLGSRDPAFLFHAGVAAARAGREGAARRWLGEVVRRTPRFHPLHGPQARRELARLGADAV
jgi:pentatricopeptide repeat protein